MSTHNIPFLNMKGNLPKLSQFCNYVICSKGSKNEFETAVVNEPSVCEPSKFYCTHISNFLGPENLFSVVWNNFDFGISRVGCVFFFFFFFQARLSGRRKQNFG